MSKRLNILTSIQAKLETLSGFETVLYGQTVDFEYDKVAIAFQPISHDYKINNQQYENEIEIQVRLIKFTDNLLTDGENLLDELESLIRDENWGNNAVKTVLLRNQFSFGENGKKAFLLEFDFKVMYRI